MEKFYYVQRNEDGVIVAIYQVEQPGITEDEGPYSVYSPEIQDYLLTLPEWIRWMFY